MPLSGVSNGPVARPGTNPVHAAPRAISTIVVPRAPRRACTIRTMNAIRSAPVALALAAALLAGCTTAQQHARDVQAAQEEGGALTVGKAQSEIAKGMSGAQVAESLGSPNIVTTDELGREVWVYDRFATDVTFSQSGGGVWLILALIDGQSGSRSRSQRTLTVIVKFDETKKVRDIAYHSSRF